MKTYDVAIIGGGPAGSAAAIRLARAGHSVLLLEAKPIPHDKLCGEFLSPECKSLLAQLGLSEKILTLHPKPIYAARLIAADGTQWSAPWPSEAWGLSRYQLDAALVNAACECGAVVHDTEKCVNICGDLQRGFDISARHIHSSAGETYRARVAISAHGKRSTLDRALHRNFLGRAYPLFGMKRHFHGPPLPTGVVLHGFAGGYCGLAEIERGVINLCFLADEKMFRGIHPHPSPLPHRERATARPSPRRGEGMGVRGDHPTTKFLSHLAAANPSLGEWLRAAEPIDEQWLSVGALAFGARGATSDDILMVGDAAGLMAPLAGDGIAMALRSGQMCAAQVQKFLQGQSLAATLKANYARAWNAEFLPRIRLAGMLQSLALRSTFMHAMLRLFQQMPSIGQWMVKHTRA